MSAPVVADSDGQKYAPGLGMALCWCGKVVCLFDVVGRVGDAGVGGTRRSLAPAGFQKVDEGLKKFIRLIF